MKQAVARCMIHIDPMQTSFIILCKAGFIALYFVALVPSSTLNLPYTPLGSPKSRQADKPAMTVTNSDVTGVTIPEDEFSLAKGDRLCSGCHPCLFWHFWHWIKPLLLETATLPSLW